MIGDQVFKHQLIAFKIYQNGLLLRNGIGQYFFRKIVQHIPLQGSVHWPGANEHIKTLDKENVSEDEVKKAELRIQELTDGSIKKIDELAAGKEKEIMTV